jgi:hypothetical protein
MISHAPMRGSHIQDLSWVAVRAGLRFAHGPLLALLLLFSHMQWLLPLLPPGIRVAT